MVLRSVVLVVLAAITPITLHAQAKSPIEGVWKVTEIQVTGGPTPGGNTTPQPGLYIFTRGHYSVMTITTSTPRTPIPPSAATLTDKEKIALYEHWAPFTANAGTYTITGSTLMTKPLVAKNEGVMQGAAQQREFKLEGNTLWLVQKPAAGQAGAEIRTKLTRLE